MTIERILIVAGHSDAGKSTLFRRIVSDQTQQEVQRLPKIGIYCLKGNKRLLLLPKAPPEYTEYKTLEDYLECIKEQLDPNFRWSLAIAARLKPSQNAEFPGLRGLVDALKSEFTPTTMLIGVLSPDFQGRHADPSKIPAKTPSRQVRFINPRDKIAVRSLWAYVGGSA